MDDTYLLIGRCSQRSSSSEAGVRNQPLMRATVTCRSCRWCFLILRRLRRAVIGLSVGDGRSAQHGPGALAQDRVGDDHRHHDIAVTSTRAASRSRTPATSGCRSGVSRTARTAGTTPTPRGRRRRRPAEPARSPPTATARSSDGRRTAGQWGPPARRFAQRDDGDRAQHERPAVEVRAGHVSGELGQAQRDRRERDRRGPPEDRRPADPVRVCQQPRPEPAGDQQAEPGQADDVEQRRGIRVTPSRRISSVIASAERSRWTG